MSAQSIVTKAWTDVWNAMRDQGDDAASKLLGPLLIKDRFDSSRVGLDGATAEGWTLFHKAALHQCPQCGARLLAAATRKPKNAPSDWSGASEGLALMAMTTANGSTALEVAQRWGNNAFTKLLITKKREFDMQMRAESAAAAARAAAAEEAKWGEDYSEDDDDDSEDEGGGVNKNRGGGNGSVGDGGSFDGSLLLEDEPPHGGRSDEWWEVWHALHKGTTPDATAAIPLKDYLQTPQGLAEATATSNLPRSTLGMTLLHQAALNGGTTCLGMLLRSGAYPGDPTQWLFDLKGRSPKECANRFQRKDAVVALDNYAHAVAKQERKQAKKKRQQSTVQSSTTGTASGSMSASSLVKHGPWGYGPSTRSTEWWAAWHGMHANDRRISSKALDELNVPELPPEDEEDAEEDEEIKGGLEDLAGTNSSSNLSPGMRKLRLYFWAVLDSRMSPHERDDHEGRKACDIGTLRGRSLLEQAAANGHTPAVTRLIAAGLHQVPRGLIRSLLTKRAEEAAAANSKRRRFPPVATKKPLASSSSSARVWYECDYPLPHEPFHFHDNHSIDDDGENYDGGGGGNSIGTEGGRSSKHSHNSSSSKAFLPAWSVDSAMSVSVASTVFTEGANDHGYAALPGSGVYWGSPWLAPPAGADALPAPSPLSAPYGASPDRDGNASVDDQSVSLGSATGGGGGGKLRPRVCAFIRACELATAMGNVAANDVLEAYANAIVDRLSAAAAANAKKQDHQQAGDFSVQQEESAGLDGLLADDSAVVAADDEGILGGEGLRGPEPHIEEVGRD